MKVLCKEKVEHVCTKAHTTDSAQSAGHDSVNILKTFPTTTLGEKSSKGPRCQETKGVEGASARQKTSTKSSKDPSRVVNTPKGGEDRYNYEELMETLGNINMDVLKQGAEIEELKVVILSQQVQISKLKKMVLRLVQKKKRKQYVLKKRGDVNDAFKKGESQAEGEKQNPVGLESHFEGGTSVEKEREIGATSVKEAETDQAAETSVKEAVTEQTTVTTPEVVTTAVETGKVGAEIGMSAEEIEIEETLVKAKTDTPKATQKAKGVIIKEGGSEQKKKKISEAEFKKKGKEKVVESKKRVKNQKQIALDEELAKKLQAELTQEEESQTAKDREIALELSTKLNEEFQRSLKTSAIAKKVTLRATKQSQRNPSKTFLENQERRKMINFLKGAIGVPEGMFTSMTFGRKEELHQKEMAKLKGDFIQRVEIGAIKRKKSIATKPKEKRPRIEEVEKEIECARAEPSAKPEQNQEQSNQQSNEQFHLYMTLTDEESVQVDPISMQAPEIIHWDILKDNRKDYFRFKRKGDQYEVYATWGKIVRSCTRSDLEELYKVGLILYKDVLEGTEMSLIKIAMEYLCMMFEPERVKYRIKDLHHEYGFKNIDHWMLFENCGVYMITIDKSYHEYYLVDKIYDHS
ncbi:hypothetical protein L6452_15376 [Arctium lappa]|uniref:Uncharacterized protein n=1 Tax=Arctium lappa TaxID=4217 RepID=A0ACB9CNM0_ARCLA|nr:hypothetical protein L6452_15376 [Arctium lappa]